MAKRKRRRRVINVPRRDFLETEEEHLLACIDAGMRQVETDQAAIAALVDKLCRAQAKLRETEKACNRYVAKLNRLRGSKLKLHGGVKGNGCLLIED